MGLGETSKVFVIFWATLFPVLLATIGGVKQVDRKLIEMAESYGAAQLTVFRRVVLPASVPSIFVGLRLSATTALLLLIAAEMIGANKGVGFQVMNAQFNFQIPTDVRGDLPARLPRARGQRAARRAAGPALPLGASPALSSRPISPFLERIHR